MDAPTGMSAGAGGAINGAAKYPRYLYGKDASTAVLIRKKRKQGRGEEQEQEKEKIAIKRRIVLLQGGRRRPKIKPSRNPSPFLQPKKKTYHLPQAVLIPLLKL